MQVKIREIAPADNNPLNRRQREREAVRRILEEIAAPGATVEHNADGAPIVKGIPYISITHSQRLAAVATSDTGPIGIDAEEWRSALERVKTRFLSAEELEWCDDLLLAWTIKEAVYKASGIKRLTGPEIHLSIDYLTAEAQGVTYNITSYMEGPTRISIAIPQKLTKEETIKNYSKEPQINTDLHRFQDWISLL
ncbi:MAG: 4'-phosphopantetheinyl transferase superfamily protein [Bacteroidales bacterium]|nr:4'-phosphopantetheinyl transferase superfamily protein [Bacteroidales bacterium]